MKRAASLITLMALTITFALISSGQKADFSGTWKLDREKSMLAENTPVLTKITINIKGDSLVSRRFYDIGDGQEYPFDENISLDGTESNIIIYEMPRKAKAKWSVPESTVNLESTITFNGSSGPEDFNSKETWKIDKENSTLTINYVNKTAYGESNGHFIFTKEGQ
jgi:hypothetical protein